MEFPTTHQFCAMIFPFVVIAFTFTLLRLHRRFHDKALQMDDALCVIALVRISYILCVYIGNELLLIVKQMFAVWTAIEVYMQTSYLRDMYYWRLSLPPGKGLLRIYSQIYHRCHQRCSTRFNGYGGMGF
jgi:hypothetical protein